MSRKIAGLTIEIGGNTGPLNKALGEVNKKSRDLQSELKQVERLLKLDPKNTELLAQKQKILAESITNTKSKLETLKEAERQLQEQFKQGKIAEDQYRAIQQEVIKTEQNLKKLEQQLKETNNNWKDAAEKLDKFGKKSVEIGKDMTTKVTLPILGAGAASFKFASDLQDAFGATEQIFKSAADEVKNWADNLESYYGIAETEALEYANTMGAMLQNIGGLSEQEAAKQAQILVELAGDLAAMFGGTTESAVQALTGALKGNNSMLDNYGMGVNEATIKTKAFEMGLVKEKEELSLAAKQAATLALIMEQTADAQGQAAREAEGASGSMRGLVTELKNLATEIGEVLLPIITPLIAKLKDIIAAFGNLSPEMQKAIVVIGGVVAAIGPVLVIIGKLSTLISAIIQLFGAGGAAAGIFGKVIAALTGPIGIAIAAVTALITAGVALYKNWDTVKAKAIELSDKVASAWNNMKIWVLQSIDEFIQGLQVLLGWIPKVNEALNGVRANINSTIDEVKQDQQTLYLKRAYEARAESARKALNQIEEDTESTAVAIETTTTNTSNYVASTVGKAGKSIKETVKSVSQTIAENLQAVTTKIGETISIIEKELELWRLKNNETTESSEYLTKQLEMQNEKHKLLNEQIVATKNALEAAIAEYGAGSSEALKYKNALLDLQIQQEQLKDSIEATNEALSNQNSLTIGDDYFSIGNVVYDKKSSNKQYEDRKKSDFEKYKDEIYAIAKKYKVDISTGYEMWKTNEREKLFGRDEPYSASKVNIENITVNSPKALSPSETAKEIAKTTQKLVLGLLR